MPRINGLEAAVLFCLCNPGLVPVSWDALDYEVDPGILDLLPVTLFRSPEHRARVLTCIREAVVGP